MSLIPFLHRICDRNELTSAEAAEAMEVILSGQATQAQIAGFLVALRMRGETAAELSGFARAMRLRSEKVSVRSSGTPLLDTCGTGGDGLCTFNISTTAAFVAAGAGARVAKHGNRSQTSQCGSADILEALGVRVELSATEMGRCIDECGIGFLYAPAIHPAMRHAAPARRELKIRTAFNLLGPLTNPAGATAQLSGAPTRKTAQLLAEALADLDTTRALVVHGSDGLDEITTTGPTDAWLVEHGQAKCMPLHPSDFGIPVSDVESFKGGDRDENAAITRAILDGAKGPARDIVLVNTAAALWVAGMASTLMEGMRLATQSIDSGRAARSLDSLRRVSVRAA